ncbi:site-specific integrase [Shewanella sp. SW36]|uniref:tyrosine-type recombinase/integrase n=1 Tax=unclassified Shewanella TaxID=196818 RepID=UPI0021D9CF08|nr:MULTISPECIES: site-specific integrase [unclassified Shewanella]MCU7963980.1 site-specific integrase [Shewanella sp. SW32]MCU7971797.1 site-specific integrase [Shewanella sp. SW29]MCU7976957.1 site-specific integrase [Shewanella sp. SW36]MCU7992197.1 site-specific integrase [Shewanella sp. SW1]MCU8054500.1 site-specific integrase [Shewanella sp. SM43]
MKFLYSFFMENGIDLVGRVACGSFLSIEEIDDYIRAGKFYLDTKDDNKDSTVVSLTDKRIRDAIHATSNSQPEVSAHTFNQRLNRLKAYIEFLYVCHHYDRAETDQQISTDAQFNKFKLYISSVISHSRKDNTVVKDPFESVISANKFFDLLEIIKERSPNNPFKSSKLRNQIIAQILIDTGVRVGAVLKLKVSDLVDDWGTPRFRLTRTPNDPTDTRRLPAANKTKALSVSISRDLIKLIKLYIETVRNSTPNAHEHDFVFISEKGKTIGKPISYNAIHKVIKTFGDATEIALHPHLLRHKWNEIFEDKAKEKGFSADKIEDLRKYAMGWVEDSKMASVYNEFQLAVTVAEISSKNLRRSVPNLRGDQ